MIHDWISGQNVILGVACRHYFECRENSELPRRKDDVMREKRVGLVGALGGAVGGGSSSATGESDAGERTISPGVRDEVCSRSGGGLCLCNAAVGGMFVTWSDSSILLG
jgi:hypothetical protein